jgi:hypothetical protein
LRAQEIVAQVDSQSLEATRENARTTPVHAENDDGSGRRHGGQFTWWSNLDKEDPCEPP